MIRYLSILLFPSILAVEADEPAPWTTKRIPAQLEYQTDPIGPWNACPAHTVYLLENGVKIAFVPLWDDAVVNFFGAYPTHSSFAKALGRFMRDDEELSNKSIPAFPVNASRYMLGGAVRYSIGKLQGISFYAQYSQGPGDHRVSEDRLTWSFYGIARTKHEQSSRSDRKYLIKVYIIDVTHPDLSNHTTPYDGGIDGTKKEEDYLNSLKKSEFKPNTKLIINAITAITKEIEQDAAPDG